MKWLHIHRFIKAASRLLERFGTQYHEQCPRYHVCDWSWFLDVQKAVWYIVMQNVMTCERVCPMALNCLTVVCQHALTFAVPWSMQCLTEQWRKLKEFQVSEDLISFPRWDHSIWKLLAASVSGKTRSTVTASNDIDLSMAHEECAGSKHWLRANSKLASKCNFLFEMAIRCLIKFDKCPASRLHTCVFYSDRSPFRDALSEASNQPLLLGHHPGPCKPDLRPFKKEGTRIFWEQATCWNGWSHGVTFCPFPACRLNCHGHHLCPPSRMWKNLQTFKFAGSKTHDTHRRTNPKRESFPKICCAQISYLYVSLALVSFFQA